MGNQLGTSDTVSKFEALFNTYQRLITEKHLFLYKMLSYISIIFLFVCLHMNQAT